MGVKSAHLIEAVAHNPDGGTVHLSPIEASVTMDESWAPFIQGSLTCWAADAETLALLDPRLDTRVTLTLKQSFGVIQTVAQFNAEWAGKTIADFNTAWAGKTFKDFNRAHTSAWNLTGFRAPSEITLDVTMRSRAVDHAAGTVTFEVASDEALLQDFALVSDTTEGTGGTSVLTAVNYALAKIGATVTGTTDATVEAESLVWAPGVSADRYLTPPLQAANLRLHCDEARVWRLGTPVFDTPGSIRLSELQSVTRAEQTISRDAEWYDAVVIRYLWTDEFNIAVTAYDTATTPGYTKVLTLEYDKPYPGPGAAQGILDRAAGRGRVFDVEATSDYSVYPGKDLILTLPDTPVQSGVVSAVTWTFPADRMTVTSRGLTDTPPTAWVAAPEGYTWADSPAGTSWLDYTPPPV